MKGHQEMQIFNDKTPEHTQIEVEGQSTSDRDRDELARLGKKQVLKVRAQILTSIPQKLTYGQRNFGFMSMLGFSCTTMVTWEGILVYVALLQCRHAHY